MSSEPLSIVSNSNLTASTITSAALSAGTVIQLVSWIGIN
jgi:hypothetical protein